MSDINPYQSPASPAEALQARPDEDARLFEAARVLGQVRPWVRFLSVLAMLMFGLSAVGVGVLALIGGKTSAFSIPAWLLFGMAVGVTLSYLFPSILLWRYTERIDAYQHDQTPGNLAQAFAAQKVFWNYLGVVGILIVIFTVAFRVMQMSGWNPVG